MTINHPAQAIADFLANLRADPKPVVGLPPALRPTNLTTAYKAQDALVAQLLAKHGGQRIGYKIACTNEIAQRQLHISAPLYGQLLAFSTYASPAQLDPNQFTVRIIEVEFGFQMGQDVPPSTTPYERTTITPFVAVALPGIEIVNHRFVDWTQVGAPTVAADNAIHGAWVHGAPYPAWQAQDLATHQAILRVNGEVVRRGQGSAVLGHPLNVVAWLANELQVQGKQLKAGDFITTGVISEVYFAQPGDVLQADFGLLGKVDVKFTV